jgi:polyhydroxyalkanoate synthesis regulator phasin
MAFTAAEESRINAIEVLLTKAQTAITNLASQKQLRTLVVLKQKEIDDLTVRVTALESQVTALQSKP